MTQEERRQRRLARQSDANNLNAWQRALLGNLKLLRGLLASEHKTPAYTVFSDASLVDMVKRRPQNMDEFLDVSGVGLSKQEKYGEVFLSVIRDGQEPNDAMLDYLNQPRVNQPHNGGRWTEAEDEQLRKEYLNCRSIDEIAREHGRSSTGIRMRLQKLDLIE